MRAKIAPRRRSIAVALAVVLLGAGALPGWTISPALARSSLGAAVAERPADLSLLDFFAGRATSSGTIVTALVFREAFTARFVGTVTGNRLRLDERFRFEDGNRLQRWDLRWLPDGRYVGTVSTELSDGTMAPPAHVEGWPFAQGVVLAYDGYAPGGGRTLLGFRHVMRRAGPGLVRNEVTISKYGVAIAGADVIFRRGARSR